MAYKPQKIDIDPNDIWKVDRCPNCGCPGSDVEIAHCALILFRCDSELMYDGMFHKGEACDYIKELLAHMSSIPPIDCSNNCMDGHCDCSGKWRKSGVDY